jgi:hypothetical protein
MSRASTIEPSVASERVDEAGIGVLRRWFNHGGELVSIRNKRTQEMTGKKRPPISSQI